jgi:oligopeptidase B
MRTNKINDTVLYLNTNMDAGHGASGRFEAIKELAKDIVFY